MHPWTILFFPRSGDQHAPLDYIRQLTGEEQNIIRQKLEVLRELEFPQWRATNWVKQHTGDIWQLRCGDHRLLFVLDGKQIVVVHAFRKKTEKTETRHIRRAIANYQSYREQRDSR